VIFELDELTSHPEDKDQWYMYYNLTDDALYIQVLATTDPSYPQWEEFEKGEQVRDSMRISGTLTRSQYSAKDFQTYKDEITARIKEKWGDFFNAFISADTTIMLVDYVSAALDQLSWYVDRESDEWYLGLARIKSNISIIAESLGYKSNPAQPSLATLSVVLPDGPYAFDVPLRKGHIFQSTSGIPFELDSDQVIPAGSGTEDNPFSINVYQGQTFTEVFAADGSLNPVFNLGLVPLNSFLTDSHMVCSVKNVEWTLDDFLPFDDSEVYEVNFLSDPPTLKFGNNIVGKKPNQGDEIRISYVTTLGKAGGLVGNDQITSSVTPVVVNFQSISIDVTNDLPSSSGSDPESSDSIKANAPKAWMAADRFVTGEDISALLMNYPGVEKSNAISIRDIEQDLELQGKLTDVSDHATSITQALSSIDDTLDVALGYTGPSTESGTILNLVTQIHASYLTALEKTADILTHTASVETAKTDTLGYVESARSRMGFLPYSEIVGKGDGSTTNFQKYLTMKPVVPGSFFITVAIGDPYFTNESSPNGDCDTYPGFVDVSTHTFTSNEIGRLIRIGSDMRQIVSYTGTRARYSGPRIYGTSLIVEIYSGEIAGYDQGNGTVSGVGISSGTITYGSATTSPTINITFSPAPSGVSGSYGAIIFCAYQYEDNSMLSIMDDLETSLDTFSDIASDIEDTKDEIDISIEEMHDASLAIDTATDSVETTIGTAQGQITTALLIPSQLSDDVDTLTDYLSEVISSEGKANIVRLSILQKDSNGFYSAPTQALMNAVKEYADDRRIETVNYSIISGAYYMLAVSLSVEISVYKQYLFDDVKTDVETALNELFKDRDYEEGLMRSDYYGVVKGVDGVKHANIEIASVEYYDEDNGDTPPQVDADGNLFIDSQHVITKGEFSIVEI